MPGGEQFINPGNYKKKDDSDCRLNEVIGCAINRSGHGLLVINSDIPVILRAACALAAFTHPSH